MTTSEHPKGHITIERTVWCGNCNLWHQESAPNIWPFLTLIRNMGWVSDRERGWLCPTCAKNLSIGA